MSERRGAGSRVRAGMRVGRPWTVVLAATVVVLAGCSSDSSSIGAEKRSSTNTERVSAGRRILDGIRPDGTVPLLVAEQAFSLAVTPLPGVTIPPGPRDDTLFSATAPIEWLRAHRDELTAAQHRVADPWLDRAGGGSATRSANAAASRAVTVRARAFVPSRRARRPMASTEQRYQAAIAQVLPALAAHFGPLGFGVPVVIEPEAKGTAYALASANNTECELSVFPKGYQASGSDLMFVVAHELTHCFQARSVNSAIRNSSSASWVTEGGASWAGLAVSGPSQLMIDHWREYIEHPETPLFSRAYDAVGFFAHLAESGTDPWKVLIPMINAPDNPGRYDNAVGGSRRAFEDSWASGMFRNDPMAGKAWNTDGVGMPTTRPSPQQTVVGQDVETPGWTLATVLVATDQDVTKIRAGGSVRVGSGVLDQVVAPGSTIELCTKEGGCTCPAGSTGSPPTASASSPIAIALTGGSAGATAQVSGEKLSAYCKRVPTGSTRPRATGACRFLSQGEVNRITGLAVGPGVARGDSCVFVDPAQPAASPNLNLAAALLPKVLPALPTGTPHAGVVVFIGDAGDTADSGGDGGDASGLPPGCASFDPGVGRTALGVSCPPFGMAFAAAGGRTVPSIDVMYFPSGSGLGGLDAAIRALITTAVSHD